eukprot:6547132-Prymnesium_polylepis.1
MESALPPEVYTARRHQGSKTSWRPALGCRRSTLGFHNHHNLGRSTKSNRPSRACSRELRWPSSVAAQQDLWRIYWRQFRRRGRRWRRGDRLWRGCRRLLFKREVKWRPRAAAIDNPAANTQRWQAIGGVEHREDPGLVVAIQIKRSCGVNDSLVDGPGRGHRACAVKVQVVVEIDWRWRRGGGHLAAVGTVGAGCAVLWHVT